jgi:hypothetical protein
MELIGIELAKVVSLFFVSRPSGQPPLGRMGVALTERYNFAIHPTTIEQMVAEKIEFGQGAFGETRIDLLEVFQDGIVVTAKSPTEGIEAFMDDLVSWGIKEFGLVKVETQSINLAYESHLLIKSDKPILGVLDPLQNVQSLIKKLLFASTKIDAEFEPFGFNFSADPTKIASMKPARFIVERKVGASFDSNLYFSAAPLKTSDHLKVLELLESSL